MTNKQQIKIRLVFLAHNKIERQHIRYGYALHGWRRYRKLRAPLEIRTRCNDPIPILIPYNSKKMNKTLPYVSLLILGLGIIFFRQCF